MSNNKILILSDGKLGHQNQSVRIAERLGVDYDVLALKRRVCGKAFSFVCSKYIVQNMNELKSQLANNNYNIVIGIGTVPRLAMIWVKQHYPNIKTVCIMDPKSNYNSYDLILMPNHDNSSYKGNNVINITGSLSYFKVEELNAAKEEFKDDFARYKDNGCLGILIGGNSRSYNFDKQKAQDIISKSFLLSKKTGMGVYATISRRTPGQQAIYIKEIILKSANQIFTGLGRNPYRAILGYSSIIVVTPETVSMLMEAAATPSLVLVANKHEVKSDRIQNFISELLDNNYIYELDYVSSLNKEEIDELIEKSKNKKQFDDLNKVVSYIKDKNWI